MKQYHWIESAGGPLVMVDETNLKYWSGIYNRQEFLDNNIEDSDDFLNPLECDYGLACTIEDYIGLVPIVNLDVLILGNEPFPSAIIRSDTDEVVIARLYFGNELTDNILQKLDMNSLKWEFSTTLTFYSNKQYIFDSATCNKYLNDKTEYLTSNLAIGNYNVMTYIHEIDPDKSIIMHRIKVKK